MLQKQCNKCDKIKHISEFNKHRTECKSCAVQLALAIQRTKKGLCYKIYSSQKQSSKRRLHTPPTYTRDELKDWLYSQKRFHLLYDNWKRLDYQKEYIPSVDRKDDNISYTMDNIQLMTWQENNNKYYADRKNGIANNTNEPVIKIDIDGVETEYYSIAEAQRITKVHGQDIGKCCRNIRKSAGGFKWKYKGKYNEVQS